MFGYFSEKVAFLNQYSIQTGLSLLVVVLLFLIAWMGRSRPARTYPTPPLQFKDSRSDTELVDHPHLVCMVYLEPASQNTALSVSLLRRIQEYFNEEFQHARRHGDFFNLLRGLGFSFVREESSAQVLGTFGLRPRRLAIEWANVAYEALSAGSSACDVSVKMCLYTYHEATGLIQTHVWITDVRPAVVEFQRDCHFFARIYEFEEAADRANEIHADHLASMVGELPRKWGVFPTMTGAVMNKQKEQRA